MKRLEQISLRMTEPIVEGLEVVQITMDQCERTFLANAILDLSRDLEVAGQTGER